MLVTPGGIGWVGIQNGERGKSAAAKRADYRRHRERQQLFPAISQAEIRKHHPLEGYFQDVKNF